jgi:putative acetyltransferase
MSGSAVDIRIIRPNDDKAIRQVILTCLDEFGIIDEAESDSDLESISTAFLPPRHRFFVALDGQRVIGGCGIRPLGGGDGHVAEIRKAYIVPEYRGKGIGLRLLNSCIEAAQLFEFTALYVETKKNMGGAKRLYTEAGFAPLDQPHSEGRATGRDFWMIKAVPKAKKLDIPEEV